MDTCQRFAFPTYRESEFADLQPLKNMPTIPFFEEADIFPLQVPLEAHKMGHKVWDLPISPFNFPSDCTPAERVGTEEESVIRAAWPILDFHGIQNEPACLAICCNL